MALMFTACTTSVQVKGKYAATLSRADLQQIKQLAHSSPRIGRTVVTYEALRLDRGRVESRTYSGSGWNGASMYVVRHHGGWQIDERFPSEATAARTIMTH